ncbi:BF3164 family lipoprotein [Roseivirga pacifica]|uniref:BF3164 family lipoprotein n=1 Tax=Roseivirga pacifica TaxID=1267423 RepID=UPI00227D342E|nr:BF3164 family lipoprotein [Roseivirga pacifica]
MSCNTGQETGKMQNGNEFQQTEHFTEVLDSLAIDVPLLQVRNLTISDDFILALTTDPKELVKVFSLADFSYVGGFGYGGEGPGDLEFNRINSGGFTIVDHGSKLQIIDAKFIRTIDLKEMGKREPTIHSKTALPETAIRLNQAHLVGNDFVFGKTSRSIKQLSYINLKTGETTDTIPYPNYVDNVPAEAFHHLYSSNSKVDESEKYLALAYLRFPVVRVFDLESGEERKSGVPPKTTQNKVIVAENGLSIDNSNLVSYYSGVDLSEDRVFALYQEKNSAFNPENPSKAYTEKELHVFDFEGNAIKKIILPEWVNRFAVSPNGRQVICSHPENENYLYRVNIM